ncbi:hypothetical protein BDW74DRAFT_34212 [Aspergillus multicolor]|uniref:uncharacterized protein n=1 Tax=Aspergillus multicolor TaxID=41759 RepID=UPI003CCE389A
MLATLFLCGKSTRLPWAGPSSLGFGGCYYLEGCMVLCFSLSFSFSAGISCYTGVNTCGYMFFLRFSYAPRLCVYFLYR